MEKVVMNIYQETEYFEHHIRQLGWEKVTRCKDCKHFELDHFDMWDGVPIITGHEICKKWSGGSKTSANGYCFMAERKEE